MSPQPAPIAAREAIALIRSDRPRGALIDVRSEGEFAQGSLPGFVNLPILTNDERARVGTTYKKEGQEAAVRLGHELVDPVRPARVAGWLAAIRSASDPEAPGIVACWRGGMRSGITAQWIREGGGRAVTVQGGYKAIRRELLAMIEPDRLPPLRVLSGLTGSGKTRLLHELRGQVPLIDLEGLAVHRGSSFGRSLTRPQPTQATFENLLGLALWDHGGRAQLLEDESANIGWVRLPNAFKDRMKASPVILLEASLEERTRGLYAEYVEEPLRSGIPEDKLRESLQDALMRLKKRLGLELALDLSKVIDQAFRERSRGLHEEWIRSLLANYYDKLYQYSFDRQTGEREVLFRGDYESCRRWISASLRP